MSLAAIYLAFYFFMAYLGILMGVNSEKYSLGAAVITSLITLGAVASVIALAGPAGPA